MIAFMGPLVAIVLIQFQEFGYGLLLGWDSSTYAWWATQVQQNGVLPTVVEWRYPNLYILILSGFGSLVGSVSFAEHVLPLIVSLPLGYSYYALTLRITNNRGLGLFAAFLGGVSMATIEMVSDLHRNLLALSIALPLGASIYMTLFAAVPPAKILRNRALAVWLPLFLVIAATHFETYVVLAVALLFACLSFWKLRRFFELLILLVIPIGLLLPVMSSYLTEYVSQNSKLLPFGPPEILAWSLLYFSGFAIPLMFVGFGSLYLAVRKQNPTARYLLVWLAALVLLLPLAIAIGAPPTRLIFFVPLPVLLAIAVPDIAHWLERVWRFVRLQSTMRTRGSGLRATRDRRLRHPRAGWPVVILVAVALVATPVVFTTAVHKDQLRPFVSEDAVQRLTRVGTFALAIRYPDPIIVLYGKQASLFASLYRAYFGMTVPNNLAYYGKMQFLLSLPNPALAYSWKYDSRTEMNYAMNFQNELLATVGKSGITSHPIVIAGGDTYDAFPSETFLGRFAKAPGIYVIPAGALSPLEIDTWQVYAAIDCFDCGGGIATPNTWSHAPIVLGYLDLSNSSAFGASYVVSLVRNWSGGNLRFSFWDFPDRVPAIGGGYVSLAPIEFYLDGNPVLSHSYQGAGAIELTAPTGPLAAGLHRISVKSTLPGYGVEVALDAFELIPS